MSKAASDTDGGGGGPAPGSPTSPGGDDSETDGEGGDNDHDCTTGCSVAGWKECGWASLLFLFLLALVGGSTFALYHFTTLHDDHVSCVQCFEEDHGVAFDQKGGVCHKQMNFTEESNSSNSSSKGRIELDRYVLNRDFCGAAYCQTKLQIFQLRAVPYWIVIASAFVSVAISALVNLLSMFIAAPANAWLDGCCLWHYRKYVTTHYKCNDPTWVGRCSCCLNDAADLEYDAALEAAIAADEVLQKRERGSRKWKQRLKIVERQLEEIAPHLAKPGSGDALDTLESLTKEQKLLVKIFGVQNAGVFFAAYAYAIVHFVYLIATVEGTNPWARYSKSTLQWIGSGTVELLCVSYVQLLVSEYFRRKEGSSEYQKIAIRVREPLYPWFVEQKQRVLEYEARHSEVPKTADELRAEQELVSKWIHLAVLPAPLLPIFFTHVVPGAVIFFPVLLLALLILALAYGAGVLLQRVPGAVSDVAGLVLWRVAGSVFAVVLFSTFAFYAGSMWEKSAKHGIGQLGNWADTIRREFEIRSTKCFANSLLNEITAYYLQAFGLLLS